jgi:hypothetical protein
MRARKGIDDVDSEVPYCNAASRTFRDVRYGC